VGGLRRTVSISADLPVIRIKYYLSTWGSMAATDLILEAKLRGFMKLQQRPMFINGLYCFA
jgi:hypothetical protein